MISHTFIIPGQPVAKGRPRFARIGKGVRAYTPAKTQRWEDNAAVLMRAEAGMKQYNQPLILKMICVFERPQRLNRKKDPEDRIPHTAKPDGDNCLKLLQDAMIKAGIVQDDSCIYNAQVTKWYAAKGRSPKVIAILTGDAK